MKFQWKAIICLFILCAGSSLMTWFVIEYHSFIHKGCDQIENKTRNYEALSEVAPHHATIFFGDSITEYCPVGELYADYIKNTGVPVLNRGISSEQTDTMKERLSSTVLQAQPKHLVMVMGVNDVFAGVDNETITANIQEMIQLTKQQSPETEILLSSVYPFNPEDRNSLYERIQLLGKGQATIDALNVMLEQLASDEHVVFLNADPILKDSSGVLKHEYSYDGLHPNTEGYLALRPLILKHLEQ